MFFSRSEKMSSKVFSQRFNRELEVSLPSLPDDLNEKTRAIAKVFGVSRHLANAMVFGHILPTNEQLDKIAETLDVCPLWLSGKTERRKSYPTRDDRQGTEGV